MKLSRREFAAATGAAMLVAAASNKSDASGATTARAAQTGSSGLKWPPYANTIAIDAMGGFGRIGGKDDGTYDEIELADARASGLTAVRLSLAPEGAFWFNDA